MVFPKTQIWGFFFIFGKIFGKRETCQPCGFEGIFMVFPKTGFWKYSMSLCKINYPNFVNDLQKELSFLKYLSATLFLYQISNYHHIHSKSSKILSRWNQCFIGKMMPLKAQFYCILKGCILEFYQKYTLYHHFSIFCCDFSKIVKNGHAKG